MNKKKSKKVGETIINYDLCAPVSGRVSIENVRLINCNCFQTPNAGGGKHLLAIDYDVKTQTDKDKRFILVFPSFKLQAFPPEGKKEKPDLVIEATFVLIYKTESLEGLNQSNFDAFGNTNGFYNAWPYWREFVANTIARMNLPPLTIPVFRLLPAEKKSSRNKGTVKQLSNAKD